jgi:membrane-associated HD superfamily phosphohydrolase
VEKIQAKTKAHDQNMNVAAQADKQGMIMQRQLAVRKAGRAEQVTLTFQGLLNEIRKQIAIAEKIKEASKYMIADINDTIEVETEKREEIRASYKAMNAARRILAKDKDREMYDLALESTTRDYANKLGEITQFLDDSKDFINTMDLENGAADEASLSKLKEWETRSANLLEGGTGKTKYRVGALKQLPSDQGSQVIDAVIDDDDKQSYSDLFSTLDKK